MKLLCVRIFLCASVFLSASSWGERDHAPLFGFKNAMSKSDKVLHKIGLDKSDYAHHEAVAEVFKDKYFRDENKKINLEKTDLFLQKLKSEYYAHANRSYETKFLEQIDVAKTSARKAQSESIKLNVGKNILLPYRFYLIPTIEKMITSLKNGDSNEIVEGMLDDFIRGYIPYFNPSPFNARYADKINLVGGVLHFFKKQVRNKEDDRVQANNLRIKNISQKSAINRILKNKNLQVHDFLPEEDLRILLEQGFDISTLDPGKSAFWEELTAQEKSKIFFRDLRIFPDKNTKVIFDRVLLGGANSAKVRVKYKNKYGRMINAKLKVGDEVASELASAALLRLLGFNADSMIYTDKVVIYLKDKTFENFEAELRQKFGQWQNVRYNYERGVDSNGEAFITWRDTLIEARPDTELRIAPLDIASWDLSNRREYRAVPLALAWIGINDLKTDNKKALLVKKNHQWIPKHRIHDTGVSLGVPFMFTGVKSALNLPVLWSKVNQFDTAVVEKTDGGIKIDWNDFCFQYRFYGSSTYYDYKWMARKIAALSKNDIAEAMIKSGMPLPMAHLFTQKLLMRRNNIVASFELENEFDLFDVPKDIHQYNPEAYPDIVNGKINKTAYEDKNLIPIRVRTWGSLISTLISGQSLSFASFTQKFAGNSQMVSGQLVGAGVRLDHHWNTEGHKLGPLGTVDLKPGITIIPMRSVVENRQNLNTNLLYKDGKPIRDKNGELIKTHLPYMIIDSIKLLVGVGVGLDENAYLPLYGITKLNVIEQTITHRHFANTVKDAWLSPFKIPEILIKGKKPFAAYHLRDLETIETYYAVGVDASMYLGTGWAKSIAGNGVGINGVAQRIGQKLFYRDQFGRLHYVKEKNSKRDTGINLGLIKGNAQFFEYAAFLVEHETNKLKGRIQDFIIGESDPLLLQSHDHEPFSEEKAQKEMQAFKDLKHNPAQANAILNFERQAQSENKNKKLELLFGLSRAQERHWGSVKDKLIDGQERHLFQASIYSGKHLGKKVNLGTSEATDIAVIDGKSKKTILEVEKRAPDKFTILVSSRVFLRKADRDNLVEMIKKLNARYGENPSAPEENQFFADLQIPEQDEQNKYRKIYADMRVLVDGEYLLKKITEIEDRDLKDMLKQFFENDGEKIRKAHGFNDEDDSEEPGAGARLSNAWSCKHKSKKIMESYYALKQVLSDDTIKWPSVWIATTSFVHNLFSRYYGVHMLRAFLNIEEKVNKDRALLVYGEIRNIGDHIATLERPHGHHANVRCTGAHWGNYLFGKDKVRPIQYYLKYEDPINQLPIYWSTRLQSSLILGRNEQGQPPNFSGEGI